jgi:hypothetical protein
MLNKHSFLRFTFFLNDRSVFVIIPPPLAMEWRNNLTIDHKGIGLYMP